MSAMASLPHVYDPGKHTSAREARAWGIELAWNSGRPKIKYLMEGGSLAVFYSCTIVLVLMAACAGAAPDEVAALLSFKRSSVKADPRNSLQNWRGDDGGPSDPCSWAGVLCSVADGRVRSLTLSSLGLVGRLVMDDLMTLQGLRDVDLSGNFFYGNLSLAAASSSPALATPCAFEAVDLSRNNFTEGIVGGFLASCNSLLSLNLSGNSIHGGAYPFPSSLRRLDLSRNKISDEGLLNYSLSSGCRSLAYFNMSGNKLAGKVGLVSPDCVSLAVLDLSHNHLSGEIPRGFLVGLPPFLKELYLSHNNFSGDFSGFEFGPRGDLTLLDLSHNELEGRIPSFWESFTSLNHMSLSSNHFAGVIPPELAKTCATLTELDLSSNVLTGGLPAEFTSCAALQSLDLC